MYLQSIFLITRAHIYCCSLLKFIEMLNITHVKDYPD